MEIYKNGKTYSITERAKSWEVTCRQGIVTTSYKIDKEICATLEALRAYVESEKLF